MIKKSQLFLTTRALILIAIISLFSKDASAIPTFQAYIDGATAGTQGSDAETWFSTANPFKLFTVGAYGPNTTSITDVTLLVSVPQGETGTISFYTLDEAPVLLKTAGTNPSANADTNILTDILGNDGYATINSPTFLPLGMNLNNHYPLQDNVSDFLIFDISSFDNAESNLKNYDAGDGTTAATFATGEQKEYIVSYTNFSRLHFDIYGLVTDRQQVRRYVSTWDNNPGSHDSTANNGVIPEPASMSLLGLGLLGLAFKRKIRV